MISLVQSTTQGYGGGFSLAFGSNNTTGNLLVLISNQNSTDFSILDTAGNTWIQVASITGSVVNNSNGAVWVCYSCLGGANTVTIGGTGLSVAAFTIAEFSGVNALDQGASVLAPAPIAGPATWTSNAITTLYADELLLGFINCQNGGGLTVNSPFLELGSNESYFVAYYEIVSSIQTGVSATGNMPNTQIADAWAYGLFSFYESSGAPSNVLWDAMDF